MRSLGPRSVRGPTVSGLSLMGMKIYTVEARRMPRYFRVSYHQKGPRTHESCQTTREPQIPCVDGIASFLFEVDQKVFDDVDREMLHRHLRGLDGITLGQKVKE